MWTDHGVSLDSLGSVSCICFCEEEFDLYQCVNMFKNQTYYNKELLVISKGEYKCTSNENISFYSVPEKLSQSEIMNLAIELSHGDAICQWQPFDLYHPNRIISQVKMLRGNCVASLYSRYFLANTDQVVVCDKQLDCSVMFKKSCFHQLNNVIYSENKNALEDIFKLGEVARIDELQYCKVEYGVCWNRGFFNDWNLK